MKTLREQIEGRCIHFNGIQNTKCKAGVEYVRGQIPCLKAHAGDSIDCAKRQWPTPEQVDKEIAEDKAMADKYMKVVPLMGKLKREYKGKTWRGIEKCPVCGGKLHVGIAAYNGHTRGQCETKDCVGWIE